MKVSEIYELIRDLVDAGYGDSEMLFVHQQNWPLQEQIAGFWMPEWGSEDEEDDDNDPPSRRTTEDKHGLPYMYLVSGGQNREKPYGPSEAFDNYSTRL
jgi:hypothetical protein